MIIDLTQKITDLDRKPIIADGQPITLKALCVSALTTPTRKDAELTGEQKESLVDFAERIHAEDAPDLTVEDRATLRTRIGDQLWPHLWVHRARRLLDPPAATVHAVEDQAAG